MKKMMFLLVAALVFVATGCNKEDIAKGDVQYISELKINFEGDTRVSAAHSAAGLKFAWEDGDVVYIYEDKNTTTVAKNLVYDAASNSFKPASGSDSEKLEVGKKYFAVTYSDWYYISIDEVSGASVVQSKLGRGTGLEDITMISDVFEATAENTFTTMHHLVGVVEIPVKAATAGAKMQQLMLYTQRANSAVTGFFDVSPVAPYTLIYKNKLGYFENANQISSDTPIELGTTEATSIFIPAFPGTYNPIDFKYTLVGGDEQIIETNKTLVVERGKITKISELVLE